MEITDEQRQGELTAYDREQSVLALVEQLRFFPLVVERGEGAHLITPEGRRLIDFSASWSASGFGHAHPEIVAAVSQAIAQGAGSSVLSSAVTETTRLAERLIELTPVKNPERAYIGLGGTDANTAAISAAMTFTGRERVLSFEGSYHGGNGLSEHVSGMEAEEIDASIAHAVPYPVTSEEFIRVRAMVQDILSARETACVVVEAVQCDGGVNVPEPGFLQMLRDECDRTDTLLIIDEVKAGLGRTGHRFAFEHDEIRPDLVTLGKALGGGVACSAAVGPAKVLDSSKASSLLTLAGGPVSSAAANAVLSLLENNEILEQIRDRGSVLETAITKYRQSDRPGAQHVTDHRGRALLQGIELIGNERNSAAEIAALSVYRAWELGCVLYVVRDNVLEITPPYVATVEDIQIGIEIVFSAIDDAVSGRVDNSILLQFGGW